MDFSTPKNLTDVRSWFGLVNQVTYAFSMTTFMEPFRSLLKPKIQFQWNEELQGIFDKSKRQIVIEIENGVRIFYKRNQRALPSIGQNLALVTGCSRSIATALKSSPSVAALVESGTRWFTHAAESRYTPYLVVGDKSRYSVLGMTTLSLQWTTNPC